nr:MAG TPA: hypothetical protein [Caudoviricetes sp.]
MQSLIIKKFFSCLYLPFFSNCRYRLGNGSW